MCSCTPMVEGFVTSPVVIDNGRWLGYYVTDMIDKLKQAAMQRGMKLMANPKVMKVMADPRVMKLVMQAFQARGKVRAHLDERTAQIAKTLGFATKEEVATLRATIRKLEGTISNLEQKVDASGNSKSVGASAASSAAAPA